MSAINFDIGDAPSARLAPVCRVAKKANAAKTNAKMISSKNKATKQTDPKKQGCIREKAKREAMRKKIHYIKR